MFGSIRGGQRRPAPQPGLTSCPRVLIAEFYHLSDRCVIEPINRKAIYAVFFPKYTGQNVTSLASPVGLVPVEYPSSQPFCQVQWRKPCVSFHRPQLTVRCSLRRHKELTQLLFHKLIRKISNITVSSTAILAGNIGKTYSVTQRTTMN